MSLKPKKKSELKKIAEKMKAKKSKMDTKELLPPYTMIVSEGIKTEHIYLRGFVSKVNEKYKNITKESHVMVYGTGRNTQGLIRFIDKMVACGEWEKYKKFWLVYDRDDFPLGSLEDAKRRAKKAYEEHMAMGKMAPSAMAPATRMFELVEELEKYLKGYNDEANLMPSRMEVSIVSEESKIASMRRGQ